MRYYLHLVTGTRFIRDPDGAEFSGVAEAGAEAAQSARDLMSDELRRGRPIPYDWRMLVATEDDTILKTIPFSVVAHGGNQGHERKAVPEASPVRDASGPRAVSDPVDARNHHDPEPRNPRTGSALGRHENRVNSEGEQGQLTKTDNLIATARTHIEVQRVRIAILESDGRDTSRASDLLLHFEKTLQCMMERRRVIVKQLARVYR